MFNCDLWGWCDFGAGPVKIRCTKTEKHDEHKCEVDIVPEILPGPSSPLGHNVFDQKPEGSLEEVHPRFGRDFLGRGFRP